MISLWNGVLPRSADFHGTLPIYGIGAPDRALRLSGLDERKMKKIRESSV